MSIKYWNYRNFNTAEFKVRKDMPSKGDVYSYVLNTNFLREGGHCGLIVIEFNHNNSEVSKVSIPRLIASQEDVYNIILNIARSLKISSSELDDLKDFLVAGYAEIACAEALQNKKDFIFQNELLKALENEAISLKEDCNCPHCKLKRTYENKVKNSNSILPTETSERSFVEDFTKMMSDVFKTSVADIQDDEPTSAK